MKLQIASTGTNWVSTRFIRRGDSQRAVGTLNQRQRDNCGHNAELPAARGQVTILSDVYLSEFRLAQHQLHSSDLWPWTPHPHTPGHTLSSVCCWYYHLNTAPLTVIIHAVSQSVDRLRQWWERWQYWVSWCGAVSSLSCQAHSSRERCRQAQSSDVSQHMIKMMMIIETYWMIDGLNGLNTGEIFVLIHVRVMHRWLGDIDFAGAGTMIPL